MLSISCYFASHLSEVVVDLTAVTLVMIITNMEQIGWRNILEWIIIIRHL
jgi:NADH:ubiquinone oxidoreductase subunit 3 (subunit A)